MLKSLRWRFIVIFLTLVLIAIVISGVYIIQFFERYNYDLVSSRLDDLSKLMLSDLEVHSDLIAASDKVKQIIDGPKGLRIREEIYVVAGDTIVASTASHLSAVASETLNMGLLLKGLSGQVDRNVSALSADNSSLRVMDKVYPVRNNGQVVGVLYIRYDLNDTDKTVDRARTIIVQSVIIALSVTFLLGAVISKNVTEPINDITRKAYKMARGDFDQHVVVKSDDEIGKLGEMFNHLTNQLKQSLNHISQEKSKFEAIVNNIDDGIIALTAKREIVHINQKALKMLEAHHIEITDHYDDLAVQLPEQLDYHNIIKEHPNLCGTDTVGFADETFRVKFEPFVSEDNKSKGLIIVFQDITESQRLETMRKQFVANVSHELKTPITSIKSYSETLLDGAVSDQMTTQQFLEVINTEADRMNRIVRDLLQLSNFDAQRTQLNLVENDWCELLDSVLQKMDVHIKAHRHKVQCIMPRGELLSYFDYDRIEQVIVNLLSNAIKYTPENGKIRITLKEQDDAILFTIADSGVGIADEHLPHLFERFYRVDKGRSRQMGGTGLGLSIAKEIIELHGGEIAVKSQVEIGTTIYFTVPKRL